VVYVQCCCNPVTPYDTYMVRPWDNPQRQLAMLVAGASDSPYSHSEWSIATPWSDSLQYEYKNDTDVTGERTFMFSMATLNDEGQEVVYIGETFQPSQDMSTGFDATYLFSKFNAETQTHIWARTTDTAHPDPLDRFSNASTFIPLGWKYQAEAGAAASGFYVSRTTDFTDVNRTSTWSLACGPDYLNVRGRVFDDTGVDTAIPTVTHTDVETATPGVYRVPFEPGEYRILGLSAFRFPEAVCGRIWVSDFDMVFVDNPELPFQPSTDHWACTAEFTLEIARCNVDIDTGAAVDVDVVHTEVLGVAEFSVPPATDTPAKVRNSMTFNGSGGATIDSNVDGDFVISFTATCGAVGTWTSGTGEAKKLLLGNGSTVSYTETVAGAVNTGDFISRHAVNKEQNAEGTFFVVLDSLSSTYRVRILKPDGTVFITENAAGSDYELWAMSKDWALVSVQASLTDRSGYDVSAEDIDIRIQPDDSSPGTLVGNIGDTDDLWDHWLIPLKTDDVWLPVRKGGAATWYIWARSNVDGGVGIDFGDSVLDSDVRADLVLSERNTHYRRLDYDRPAFPVPYDVTFTVDATNFTENHAVRCVEISSPTLGIIATNPTDGTTITVPSIPRNEVVTFTLETFANYDIPTTVTETGGLLTSAITITDGPLGKQGGSAFTYTVKSTAGGAISSALSITQSRVDTTYTAHIHNITLLASSVT
jgi:hypothetical protein